VADSDATAAIAAFTTESVMLGVITLPYSSQLEVESANAHE